MKFPSFDLPPANDNASPENKNDNERIARALNNLPEINRRVMQLTHHEDRSPQQIAEALNIGVDEVLSLIHASEKAIRVELKKQDV